VILNRVSNIAENNLRLRRLSITGNRQQNQLLQGLNFFFGKVPVSLVVVNNWMAANTTASTRNWKVEIFIGTNVRTEIDIEYTPNGEWRVSINSEPEYRSEEQNNSEGISDSMTQSALNSQQFCRELEAKLKTNQSPLDSPKT